MYYPNKQPPQKTQPLMGGNPQMTVGGYGNKNPSQLGPTTAGPIGATMAPNKNPPMIGQTTPGPVSGVPSSGGNYGQNTGGMFGGYLGYSGSKPYPSQKPGPYRQNPNLPAMKALKSALYAQKQPNEAIGMDPVTAKRVQGGYQYIPYTAEDRRLRERDPAAFEAGAVERYRRVRPSQQDRGLGPFNADLFNSLYQKSKASGGKGLTSSEFRYLVNKDNLDKFWNPVYEENNINPNSFDRPASGSWYDLAMNHYGGGASPNAGGALGLLQALNQQGGMPPQFNNQQRMPK